MGTGSVRDVELEGVIGTFKEIEHVFGYSGGGTGSVEVLRDVFKEGRFRLLVVSGGGEESFSESSVESCYHCKICYLLMFIIFLANFINWTLSTNKTLNLQTSRFPSPMPLAKDKTTHKNSPFNLFSPMSKT